MPEGPLNTIPESTVKELISSFTMLWRLNPWSWVRSRDFFGLTAEGSAEPVFVHFLEAGDQSGRSVSLFFGWRSEALYQNIRGGCDHADMRTYELDVVRAFFVPPEALSSFEREMASVAGLPADAAEIPFFVNHHPGMIPGRITEERAKVCAEIFRQAAGVIMRAEGEGTLFRRDDPRYVWVHTYGEKADASSEGWQAVRPFIEFTPSADSIPPADKIASVNSLPDDVARLELDIDVIPRIGFINPDAAAGERPDTLAAGYFMALCGTDPDGGIPPCVGNRIFYPRAQHAAMWNVVAESLLDILIEFGRRPREIVVSSMVLMDFLRPLQTKIHFKLTFHSELKYFNAVLKRTSEFVEETIKKGQEISKESQL